MLTPNEAFRKFRSKLELTQKEQDSASSRQKEIRALMDESFDIDTDFLTGSYRRWTKTKPLKDVDIFCVFDDDERPRRRAVTVEFADSDTLDRLGHVYPAIKSLRSAPQPMSCPCRADRRAG